MSDADQANDGQDGPDGPQGPRRTPEERDMPAEWRKQHGRPTRPVDDQAGNGMQNDGSHDAVDGLDEDELELRRMMHGAVRGLTPSDDALDQLRRAVPARRARRRQIVVGTAAAALLVGTAIPAFIHVAGAGDGVRNSPAMAGGGHHTPGGTGAAAPDGGKKDSKPSGDSGTDGGNKKKGASKGAGSGTHGGSDGGVTGPSGKAPDSLPSCAAQQLGVTSAATGTPNADGTVYGTFRVSNVSHSQCAVSDAGTVNFQAMGAADAARITVVDHTAGDAAAGLPDPSQDATGLVLGPSQAYEVKFAWVPTATCPTGGGATPDPTPSAGSGDTGGSTASAGTGDGAPPAGGDTGTTPQLGSGDGTSDGSVAVVHEAEPGVPAAEATIPNACAGTIYRTGLLTAP
ncbi:MULTISPECIES: hypothetical protein [unclassified Streptomyces]|uniref:hypothetical protein n=1 Tax=unclassified Streptomyces TaxID=2593676 RepID=UPI002E120BCC|nr:hypothetical protein OG452_15745 [Streptomyces sp. NBC_01197]WSS50666.1 hypothetical protein OG708_19770 [Streptomyces sp. NBC_01180]